MNAFRLFAVRFTFTYLVLYASVVLSSLGVAGLPRYWYERLWTAPAEWMAAQLPNATRLAGVPPQPGSDAFHLALVLCCSGLAVVIALGWSLLDRSRGDWRSLWKWTRVGVRYLLAFILFHFALVKLLGQQFPPPGGELLFRRLADIRPEVMLGLFMGASYPYIAFTALCELLGGALLFARRTTVLGALIIVAIGSNVLLLSVFFDTPGKILSAHVLLLATLLVLSDVKRLVAAHLLHQPVPPADLGPGRPPHGVTAQRYALLKTAAIASIIFSPIAWVGQTRGYLFRAPMKHPLAGVYEVDTFVRGGDTIAPMLGDPSRWRRVAVSHDGAEVSIRTMDDVSTSHVLRVDTIGHHLVIANLSRDGVPRPTGVSTKREFFYDRTADGTLHLSSATTGPSLTLALRRLDEDATRLVSARNR